jgi:hypothetical protein
VSGGKAYPLAREGAGNDEGDVDGVTAHHDAVEHVEEAHRGCGGGVREREERWRWMWIRAREGQELGRRGRRFSVWWLAPVEAYANAGART